MIGYLMDKDVWFISPQVAHWFLSHEHRPWYMKFWRWVCGQRCNVCGRV